MARAYSNLGIIHQQRGDLDNAQEMHRKALTLNEQLSHKERYCAHIRPVSASIYWQTADKKRSCECLRKGRDLSVRVRPFKRS